MKKLRGVFLAIRTIIFIVKNIHKICKHAAQGVALSKKQSEQQALWDEANKPRG